MPAAEPIPDRASDCFIKFESRSEYNHFVAQLTSQLRSYLINSCQEYNVEIGSEDFRTVESIVMDVFMQYTLEFIRENLLVEGRPISPSPDLARTSTQPNGKPGDHSTSNGTGNKRSEDRAKAPTTKPCDTALNERVIRQQYALYDAAVANTRKRKDFAPYVVERVQGAASQASAKVQSDINNLDQLEAERIRQIDNGPSQRWDVVNAELPNLQRTQDDFTSSNQIMSKLMKSLPQILERATNAIELHKEVTNTLKTN